MTEDEIRFSKLSHTGVESDVRTIKQSDIQKCPHVILTPEHYREDGTCKCDDPAEQARMIREWDYTPEDFKGAS